MPRGPRRTHLTTWGVALYHSVVQARLTPLAPGARVVFIACLLLACSALGQTLIDSIRFPFPAPLPGGRRCLAYDYADRLLYIAGTGSESLFVVDDRRGAVAGAVRLEGHVTSVCYNPLVNQIYCGTDVGGDVYLVEPTVNRVVDRIRVADTILAFVLDTAANRLFCVGGSGTVPVINCATNTVEGNVTLPANFGTGVATCYVPPLRHLYVAAEEDSTLFVLDCAGCSLLSTVRVGHEPTTLCYHPANGKVYTGSRSDSTLTAIDPVTNTVVASIRSPSGAGWLCSNPTSNKVYALGDAQLCIFDGRNDSLRINLDLGLSGCHSLLWDSRHNVVYVAGSPG